MSDGLDFAENSYPSVLLQTANEEAYCNTFLPNSDFLGNLFVEMTGNLLKKNRSGRSPGKTEISNRKITP